MLEGEINSEASLQRSEKQLVKLSEEALDEHKNGLTQQDW